jgi:hypothetical protein
MKKKSLGTLDTYFLKGKNTFQITYSKFLFLVFYSSLSALIFFNSCQSNDFEKIESVVLPKMYLSKFTPQPPIVDGLEDILWGEVNWSDSFIDIEGDKTPPYQTQFKLLWDKKHLYILASLKEPHIWGNLKQRDTVIYYNNDFEIFLDPDGDTHDYMELEVNALNTAWDLFLEKPYRNKTKVDNHWDIEGMQTAVSIEGSLNDPTDLDQRWLLEIALPWTSLKKGNKGDVIPVNQFWRINFSRVNWDFSLKNGRYYRKQDSEGNYLPEYNWVWSPQWEINMHLPERWGYVYFTDNQEENEIEYPEDAQLIQWMYAQYRDKLAKEKKKIPYTSKQTASYKSQKISFNYSIFNDTVYWTTFNPINKKTYLIRNDGKLFIRD